MRGLRTLWRGVFRADQQVLAPPPAADQPIDARRFLFASAINEIVEPVAAADEPFDSVPQAVEAPAPPAPTTAASAPPPPEVAAPPLASAVAAPPETPRAERVATHPHDCAFRTPADLAVSPLPLRRALFIGACHSAALPVYLHWAFTEGSEADHVLYGHGLLPDSPPRPIEEYDFQVIMLGLRPVIPEQSYFRLAYDDLNGHQAAFQESKYRLVEMLRNALAYRERRRITTFVSNFTAPQQNLMGRLLPRYDIRNPVFFVEMLNRAIADEIAALPDVHLLDVDQISANFGRKYIQDDVIWLTGHHSVVGDLDVEYDSHRAEAPAPLSSQHVFRGPEYMGAICHELNAMYRTLRQADQVKLVIVDLDDTLWRGVVAEQGCDRPMVTEGWPIGFVEALAYLKKRGVLLAIVSKNDEARIRELWPRLYGSRFELSDFASVRINWQPKVDNIEQVLREVNLLPRGVVFIDDNPVERAAVAAAFPGIRVLGAQPYQFRRILLWAPETQVATVTNESARRTEMVHAQVEREHARSRLTRAEFLDTLDVAIRLFAIDKIDDPMFARAFELVNKSNQFNTTGRRWTQDGCNLAFSAGVVFWAFEADDRFARYGMAGVAITKPDRIEQFVMSCRVVGLDIEIAVIAALVGDMSGDVSAAFVQTDANLPCRDLYARCGFVEAEDGWIKPRDLAVPVPGHVRSIQRRPPVAAEC